MAFLGLLNIGFLELLLLTLAAVMLFGGDLPGVARKAGTLLGRLRSTADDLKGYVQAPPEMRDTPSLIPPHREEIEEVEEVEEVEEAGELPPEKD